MSQAALKTEPHPYGEAAHIPLDKINIADPKIFQQNKIWGYFQKLRNEDPVHYCAESDFGPYWSVTRYRDIMDVDTNHRQFSSSWEHGGITLFDQLEDFPLPMFIAMDPPKHTVQRKTVQGIVDPNNLKNWETLIRKRAAKVLDELPRNEPFDWVDKVSIELTTMMLATLFDFPFQDRRKLTRWSDVATGRNNRDIVDSEEQWRSELLECLEYFTNLWNERIHAEPGNDLISMLAHGEKTRNMKPMEYLGNLILLIVGGNDTTRNSMTGGLYALNLFGGEYDKLLKQPELIPNMVSEIIRWQTPLAYMRRTALEDVTLNGKRIKKGDKVAMWYVSGNRDDEIFDRPDDLWIDRPNARRQMAFGFGIHRCVGNRLAEMQLRVLWEEIVKRFPKIEVLEEPSRTFSPFVKGYTKMLARIPN